MCKSVMVGIVKELRAMQARRFLPKKLQIIDHSRDMELEMMPGFVTTFFEGKNKAEMIAKKF